MATSTIPTTIDNLLGYLQDASDLTGVQIIDGPDSRDVDREAVFVTTDDTDSEQSWASIGAQSREEDYSLRVVVHVKNPGATMKEARDRSFAIFGVVETVVRAHKDLGLPAVRVPRAQTTGPRLDQWGDDEGFGAQIISGIRVQARI